MKYKNYLIYGLSKSGKSSFELLFNKKDKFYLFDDNENVRKQVFEKTINKSNVFVLKDLDKTIVDFMDCIVISPSISIYLPIIKYAKTKNIPVISELELGFKYCKNKIIAITGTNGKTTCTNLIYDILRCGGYKKVEKVGNIGCPLTSRVKKSKHGTIFVCEVSSFQLEAIKSFCPTYAGLLNITPDHIDRHKTMQNYKNTKYKLFKNMIKNKVVINQKLNTNSIKNLKIYTFGFKKTENGCYLNGQELIYACKGKEQKVCSVKDVSLMGKHNIENVMACICFAKFFKIKNKCIIKALKNFQNSSHRIQKVLQFEGKSFYDDSKGTNIDACISAVNSFKEELFLILGGSDKGYEFDIIFKNLPQNVVKIIACGEVKNKIVQAGNRQNIKVKPFDTLKEATVYACQNLKEGQTLLLSPASASFDEFKSYKDRGQKFLEYIKEFYKIN